MFGEKMKAKWYVFRAQMKNWWLSQKKWQKALWILLLALWHGMAAGESLHLRHCPNKLPYISGHTITSEGIAGCGVRYTGQPHHQTQVFETSSYSRAYKYIPQE